MDPTVRLTRVLRQLTVWLRPETGSPGTVRGEVVVLKSRGWNPSPSGLRVAFALQAPDRLHLRWTNGVERLEAGRIGAGVWFWRPARRAAWYATPGREELGDWSVPWEEGWLALLPGAVTAERLEDESWEGRRCEVLRATVRPWGRDLVRLADQEVRFWLPPGSDVPSRVEWTDRRAGVLLDLGLRNVGVGGPTSAGVWQLRPPEGTRLVRLPLREWLRLEPRMLPATLGLGGAGEE